MVSLAASCGDSSNSCTDIVSSPLIIFPIKNMALVSAAKRTATLTRMRSERFPWCLEHHPPRGRDDATRDHGCASSKSVRDLGARQGAEADTDLVHCCPSALPCSLDNVRGAHMDTEDATAGRTRASAPATNLTCSKPTRRRALSSTGSSRSYQIHP